MRRAALGSLIGLMAAVLVAVPAVPAQAAPGPPGHTEWWFDTWNVPGLWAGGARGQGITIGEIDTGVNAGLPELSANVLTGTDFGSDGGDGRTDRDVDSFGHGTAMASLMVAHDGQDNILGVAPDAHLLPIAVPISGTTDDAGDLAHDYLVDAIKWAADHGAKIITMSLGAAIQPDPEILSCPNDEQEAINYALSKGAIVVASGGNSGDKGSPIEEPSVCLGVVSVGAVDVAGNVPVWSSRHPYLTVTAPGVNVPSIGRIAGQAFFGDGTSQAAALTAGGLALIWSKYPQLTGTQVTARLLATLATPHAERDPATGFGSIDIGAAINRTVPPNAPNAVATAVDPFLVKRTAAPPPSPSVSPAATRTAFPGSFAVTEPTGALASGEGLVGLLVGAAGLLVALVMLVVALRRRRIRVPSADTPYSGAVFSGPAPLASAPLAPAPPPVLAPAAAPTEPRPTEPRPTEPQATEPQATEPRPIEPQPTEPPSTEPRQAEPRPAEPQSPANPVEPPATFDG